ncbi:hypothetical protein IV43_GL000461 [Ligilactobacillus acidipiscis]|uniref:Uncharacterized protein n=1 Tax=Ligilactobacillus acidipiscis TaxID=89059 RepID=A0A0R2KFG9_9LACO|nr:hypothetical protein IV43_GL000461 [Ligilactobacillus acidipiscis]
MAESNKNVSAKKKPKLAPDLYSAAVFVGFKYFASPFSLSTAKEYAFGHLFAPCTKNAAKK